jgi:hypothetical protein
MIRDRCVFGIEPLGRGIEQMKTFGGNARDHFRRDPAPGERFTDAKEATGARDRSEDRIGIERFDRAKIDHFDLEAFPREFLR